jgi:hypothetical protein
VLRDARRMWLLGEEWEQSHSWIIHRWVFPKNSSILRHRQSLEEWQLWYSSFCQNSRISLVP